MRFHQICVLILPFLALPAYADNFALGTAGDFAVLGGSAVANTGLTTITGDLGVYPGTSVTGFPPGGVSSGTVHSSDAVAQQAQNDALAAYNVFAGMATIANLTGQDLGGLTLTPGVYSFDSSAQLTGQLTLDAGGINNAFWVFQIGNSLTTASASKVTFINLGTSPDEGLFWQVGGSATLGATSAFDGNILALASITLNTGATIDCGRALALNGAVTMDTNSISTGCEDPLEKTDGLSGGLGGDDENPAVPEPASFALLSSGLMALLGLARRQRRG
jgi:type VI secretion system secreted protein VgrG